MCDQSNGHPVNSAISYTLSWFLIYTHFRRFLNFRLLEYMYVCIRAIANRLFRLMSSCNGCFDWLELLTPAYIIINATVCTKTFNFLVGC